MIDISYDKNFTSNYVIKQLEKSPFVNMLNTGYSAIVYTKQLLTNYYELFDKEQQYIADSLLYVENGGRKYDAKIMYMIFENFVTNSNDNIVTAKLNNIPLFTLNQDPLIQWSRYLQHSSKFTIFEPSMSVCNNVLKAFLGNKTFHYKNMKLSINEIRPLCVTNVGENIADLLMYIAYIYNFFINCKPYIFNEVLTGSTQQIFTAAINNWFNVCYNKLIQNASYKIPGTETISNNFKYNNTDQLFADVNNINYFKKEDVKLMIKEMLNISKILQIRNNVLLKNKELYDSSITNQNTLTINFVYNGYVDVLNNLFDIIVKHNYYYVNIYCNIPRFDINNINYHELIMLTQYFLTGGEKQFIINDKEQYEALGDNIENDDYFHINDTLQNLHTKINKAILSGSKPFVSSNVYLEIITGYLLQSLENYQNDVFYGHGILRIDESDIDPLRTQKELYKLYINSKYNLHNDSIMKCLSYLNTQKQFAEEIKDIMRLSDLCMRLYDNKCASIMITSYVLSFLPEMLLLYMSRQQKYNMLNKFDYVTFLCHNHKINNNRIHKLYDMVTSLAFIHNNKYYTFINTNVKKITDIITNNSNICQPYVSSTRSNIKPITIGGISLVSKFIDSNPFVRGYYYVVSTQGNSENINTFYNFAKNIDNDTMFELFTKAINDKNDKYLQQLLSSCYNKMLINNKLPLLLSNYDINTSTGEFKFKTTDYFSQLTTSNNINIYKLLHTYSFFPIMAKDSQAREFYSRKINIDKTVTKPLRNTLMFNDTKFSCSIMDRGTEYNIPVYDFTTLFDDVYLSFVQPNGYNLLPIYIPNNETIKNNLFFVFTQMSPFEIDNINDDSHESINIDYINKPNNYKIDNANINTVMNQTKPSATLFTTNIPTMETSLKSVNNVNPKPNDFLRANRMKLYGVDKQPIPNYKQ